MRAGLIDSATISQLVQCLDRGTKTQYPWSVCEALDLTALAIRERNLAVAPGIAGPKGVAKDPLDDMVDAMLRATILRRDETARDYEREVAITKSKQWIGRSDVITNVREEVARLHSDEKNYANWIDWAANRAWASHARRFGGLLDEEYETYVARILKIDEQEVADMRQASNDSDELKRLIKSRGDDFSAMSQAYLASSIIRGRYHEELSAITNRQLKRHPLRAMVSRRRTKRSAYTVEVLPAAWCLSCVVLYGAMKQKTLNGRISSWVSNISKLRSFFDRGGLQLAPGSDAAAMDSAIFVARQAGVEIVTKRIDTILEIAMSLGVGTLTSLYLSPWVGVPAGVAARTSLKKAGFPSKIRNSFAYDTRDALLKDYMGGRIESEWSKDG